MADKSQYLEPLAAFVGAGKTVRAAAAEVGCSERQAYRISKTKEFGRLVCLARTEATGQILSSLTASSMSAVATLVEVMEDPEQKGQTRVSAAGKMLSMLGPMMELHELRQRMDDIEEHAEKSALDDE